MCGALSEQNDESVKTAHNTRVKNDDENRFGAECCADGAHQLGVPGTHPSLEVEDKENTGTKAKSS